MSVAIKESAEPVANGGRPREGLELDTPYVAPRTAAETQMAEIWRSTIWIDRIGTQDDFFDLGGDSVHGAIIMTEVARAYGVTLGLSSLFVNPTIESFVRYIVEESSGAYSSVLFPLRDGGSKAPLFLVHGKSGQIFLSPDFAHNLDPQRPVYGIQARGLNGRESPHETIVDMAEDYIGAIRSVRPNGPYSLGSFCAGSYIVLEMARILQDQGEVVHRPILIDPSPVSPIEAGRPPKEADTPPDRHFSILGFLAAVLRRLIYPGRQAQDEIVDEFDERFAPDELVDADQKRQFMKIARAWTWRRDVGRVVFDIKTPQAVEAATWTTYRFAAAMQQYEPAPYDGAVDVILCEELATRVTDRDLYLRSAVGDMRVHVAGRTHVGMLREGVSEVAKTINEILRDTA